MDKDAIDLAVHDIAMSVQVLLKAIETMQGTRPRRGLSRSYHEGELLSCAAFDLEMRVNSPRDSHMRLVR